MSVEVSGVKLFSFGIKYNKLSYCRLLKSVLLMFELKECAFYLFSEILNTTYCTKNINE
jgi:hypothetical protein